MRFLPPTHRVRSLWQTVSLALVFGLGTLAWGQVSTSGSQAKKAKHAAVRLIVESPELAAGSKIKAGLHVQLEHGWHVYWKNPGDAGLPIRLAWTLPAGFSVDSLAWPTPMRISIPPLMDYGYEGEVVFPLQIHAPPQRGQGVIRLKAHAKWLACKDICLPEEDHLELDLFWPGDEPSPLRDTHATALLALAHERLPLRDAGWKAEATLTQDLVHLALTPPTGVTLSDSLWFFPEQGDWMEHAAPQTHTRGEGKISLALKRLIPGGELPERLRGVVAAQAKVTANGPQNSFEVDLPLAAALSGKPAGAGNISIPQSSDLPGNPMESKGASEAENGGWNLLLKLALAFAGGLILNLMPCVLPVLSLKIFDFVQRAGHARLKVFAHGLTFTAGVLVSFWILAGLLLVLRQGGEQLGWGYQLQSPSFLVVLCALFFFFSLNLFGVFELGYLFTRLGQAGKQGPSGHTGSFLAGITATLVATPCTAPFMGSAMGFAFTQSAGIALLIFTSVGLGMASPYLLLAGFPSLMRILPKPGEWMEHFKQFMGFPLLATAIWLAWILGRQAGTDALIALLGVLLLGGISAWILGKWAALHRETPVRLIAITLALIVFVPAFVLVLLFIQQTSSRAKLSGLPHSQVVSESQMPWRPYQKTQVDSLVKAGYPVFIDFTADWCLSCKVNERLALDNAEVVAKFRSLRVTPFKADWTRSDPHITEALAGYGRQSVPLYVLYSGKSAQDFRILPELLSPNLVLEALEKVTPPDTALDPALGIL